MTNMGQSPMGAQKQSTLGIASTGLSVLTGIAYCLVWVAMFAMVGNALQNFQPGSNPDTLNRELQDLAARIGPMAFITGICVLGSPVLGLVGLGLGIGGAMQQNRQKVFAVTGIVFSALLLCVSCGVIGIALLPLLSGGNNQ